MKKNIYMLLNGVSTDTSGYPDIELTEAELRKYRKSMRRRIGKKHRGIVYTALALAACLTAVLTMSYFKPMDGKMRASTVMDTYTMSSMLGLPHELEEHLIRIDKTRRMDDISVTLNSAAVDESQITIYTTMVYDDAEKIPRVSNGMWGRGYNDEFKTTYSWLQMPVYGKNDKKPYYIDWKDTEIKPLIQKMYIDGQEIKCDVTAEMQAFQKGILQDVAQYNFHVEQLNFPAQIRIELFVNAEELKPDAAFEFELDENMVISNEKDIELNQVLILPDGQEVTITRFIYNELGMKFYAEYSEERKISDYKDSIILISREVGARVEYFDEYPISDTESMFTAKDNNMYSEVKTLKEWVFEAKAFSSARNNDDRWKTLDQTVTVPLK